MDHQHDSKRRATTRQKARSGNAILEFSLTILATLPLLFGVAGVGMSLGRAVQATQVTRDVAHMYGLGADFSNSGTQAIARQLGSSWNLTAGGNSVLIFSRIVKVFQSDCTTAGVACTNVDQHAFAERIVIGNPGVRSSNFGTPPAMYVDAGGDIAPANYMQIPALKAEGFESVISLGQGQNAYVTEGFFSMPDLTFLGSTTRGFYVRFVY